MTMVTTIRMDDKLHAWIKKEAQANGQTISGWYRVTAEEKKKEKEDAKRIEKLKAQEA